MEKLPEPFNMVEVEMRVKDKTPYVVVALQEATRMNALLVEMKRSMDELLLGLDGALNMSDKMEALARGISTNSVPALWMGCMSTRVQEVSRALPFSLPFSRKALPRPPTRAQQPTLPLAATCSSPPLC